jgi:hypothetical protein
MENREDVISYIGEKCESIVRLVFRMKITPEKRIRSVNRHLVEVAKSDVENNEISIGLYEDVSSFIKGNENKLLGHIINEYRLQMLKQNLDKTKRKLEKTEGDNLMLRNRNSLLEHKKTRLEDRWTRAHFKCMDMRGEFRLALQVERGKNASLGAKFRVLRQELLAFKRSVLQKERDANALLETENIRLKKALEAAKMNLDEKLDQHPGLTCPITLLRFKEAVYASDEHTYEKAALDNWIRQGGKSPFTRGPIWIIGRNRAIQDAVDAFEHDRPSP